MSPHDRFLALLSNEQTALLALRRAPFRTGQWARRGDTGQEFCPDFGKAECGWVDDWWDFYQRKLPEIGFLDFALGEEKPALGMVAGSVCRTITVSLTADGIAALEEDDAAFAEYVAEAGGKLPVEHFSSP